MYGSTVSGNSAFNTAGFLSPGGGEIDIINSTVSGNNATAGTGGIRGGSIHLYNVTVASNSGAAGFGGGLAGTFTLKNSLIAGNLDGDHASDCVGTVTSEGYNLLQEGTACVIGGTKPAISSESIRRSNHWMMMAAPPQRMRSC